MWTSGASNPDKKKKDQMWSLGALNPNKKKKDQMWSSGALNLDKKKEDQMWSSGPWTPIKRTRFDPRGAPTYWVKVQRIVPDNDRTRSDTAKKGRGDTQLPPEE